jgi:hypothetical protein
VKKKAYVFIKVSAGRLDTVMRMLSEMPQVLSAEGVSGHYDVVAIMGGPDLETLQDTILSTVRGIEGIDATETWIVMVPQPDTWTQEELDRYVSQLSEGELTALKVLLDKERGMMIQEFIDEIAERLGDEQFEIHSLTVSMISMRRRAADEFRRENLFEFDEDTGYFLNERYTDLLRNSIEKLG